MPWTLGGRPSPPVNDDDVEFIDEAAITRPDKLSLPFTRQSLRTLGAYLMVGVVITREVREVRSATLPDFPWFPGRLDLLRCGEQLLDSRDLLRVQPRQQAPAGAHRHRHAGREIHQRVQQTPAQHRAQSPRLPCLLAAAGYGFASCSGRMART
jgi:hypothetical protein